MSHLPFAAHKTRTSSHGLLKDVDLLFQLRFEAKFAVCWKQCINTPEDDRLIATGLLRWSVGDARVTELLRWGNDRRSSFHSFLLFGANCSDAAGRSAVSEGRSCSASCVHSEPLSDPGFGCCRNGVSYLKPPWKILIYLGSNWDTWTHRHVNFYTCKTTYKIKQN